MSSARTCFKENKIESMSLAVSILLVYFNTDFNYTNFNDFNFLIAQIRISNASNSLPRLNKIFRCEEYVKEYFNFKFNYFIY